MSFQTLLVCDPANQAREEIESLIQSSSALERVNTVPPEKAKIEIEKRNPRVVWIDISGQKETGLALVAGLKQNHQSLFFIVSDQVLEPDTLRAAMQAGAFDFLDSKTWSAQLPDVIERIEAEQASRQAEEERRQQMVAELERKRAQAPRPTRSTTELQKMKPRMSAPSSDGRSRTQQFVIIAAFLVAAALVYFVFRQ